MEFLPSHDMSIQHPIEKLSAGKKKLASALKVLGAIFGGLFLGCASGGAVYLAAQTTGLIFAGSLITSAFFLGLSCVLAIAWGLIYYKDIGDALVPRFLFSQGEKDIAKFIKQHEKDCEQVLWKFKRPVPDESGTTPSKALSVKDFLIVHQLKHLLAKQVAKDAAQFKLTSVLKPWDKSVREFLTWRSYEPRTLWSTQSCTLDEFLNNEQHGRSRRIAKSVYDQADDHVKTLLDTEWTQLTRPANPDELEASLLAWLRRAPTLDSDDALQLIINRYIQKQKGHHWLYRVLFKCVDAIAVTNALLVNTVGMGIGGTAIVSAVLTLLGTSLSLSMAYLTFAIFASGGFAGAFFLTRNTMKVAIRRLATWLRDRSDSAYTKDAQHISEHVKKNPQNNSLVVRSQFFLRVALAFFCAVGFSGFNLVTGMSIMALWFSPQSILDPNLARSLVSTPQPWYILGAGLASALTTFIVVSSFMMKFSTDYSNQSPQSAGSGFFVNAFIITSAILNTFVAVANYFSGSLWTNLWLTFVGVSNPLVINGFGLIMGLSVMIIGFPVFEILRSRVNDLRIGEKGGAITSAEIKSPSSPAQTPSLEDKIFNDKLENRPSICQSCH